MENRFGERAFRTCAGEGNEYNGRLCFEMKHSCRENQSSKE